MIRQWTYAGLHIPRPEQPRVHMNLWQFDGPPATEQEVVVDHFTFTPGRRGGIAELAVHDVSGALVRMLVAGFVDAGEREIAWDGRDADGRRMASGVYLATLRAGGLVASQRLVLLR